MLVSVWEGREEEVAALRARVQGLEQRQGVWEAEAAMERAKCLELRQQLGGKDEIILELRECCSLVSVFEGFASVFEDFVVRWLSYVKN